MSTSLSGHDSVSLSDVRGHTLRISVRAHVGVFVREVDLSVPAVSAISEMLPEITELCGAPQITRPWRASTAAGQGIDMAVPLHATGLTHGSVIILSPAEPVDAPILRDSAEALVVHSRGSGAAGALTGAAAVGSILVVVLLLPFIGVPYALAAGAGTALLVLIWFRRRTLLAPVITLLAAASAATFVLGGSAPVPGVEWAWVVLAATGTTVATLTLLSALGAVGSRFLAATATAALLVSVCCLGFAVPAGSATPTPVSVVAALGVVAGLVAISATPSLATTLAGLEVPRLPTAGQDLSIADGNQPDVDVRARCAGLLADGMALGTAAVMVPSLLAFSWVGGLGPQLLALATAGATVLHAARYRPTVPAYSLAVTAFAGMAGAVLAAATQPTTATVLIAAATVIALTTAVGWAGRVSTVEPTTAVWWERMEIASIVAALPLAAWVGGLFALVRGLG
ncbi:type VII secretion integral membrane protein EccD [Corynebacterium doosanense]|uniref:type VII secretion integral membrane protein EccD n=1 Tax=Corynebacterium doosanense TaxID=1121358 RepID=UPI00039FFD7A|nr:type VII secretion integral membrane protein EccD [Corynebacterium doosanense]